LGALGRRLRETNERLARQSFQTVQTRGAAALAELVATARAEGAGETDVPITATQTDLAQLAGSSRESASRFLATLERAGVITQGRGKLTVHDPGRVGGDVFLGARWSGSSISARVGADEFSAGGVVVRGGEVAVIVPVKRAADGRRVLGLPKGHLDGDESPEEAARREVAEETGLTTELVDELGDVRYRYERRGRRVAKTVRFYLFTYVSGSVDDHDHEIEEALW